MERDLETIFDTVEGLEASIVDVHQLRNMCKEQQSLTMRRISNWLRMHGRMSASKELANLGDELEYLADISLFFKE